MQKNLEKAIEELQVLLDKIDSFPIACKAVRRIKNWASEIGEAVSEIEDAYDCMEEEEGISLSEAWDESGGDIEFVNDFLYELTVPDIGLQNCFEGECDAEVDEYLETSYYYFEELTKKQFQNLVMWLKRLIPTGIWIRGVANAEISYPDKDKYF